MRKLPTLEELRVATPCMVAWDSMVGDARVRRCDTCNQNVYNISQLTRKQANELVAAKDAQMCMRYYHLADGTILLRDSAVEFRPTRLIASAAAALALAGAVAWPARTEPTPAMQRIEDPAPPTVSLPPVVSSVSDAIDRSTPSVPLHLPVAAPPQHSPQPVFVTAGMPARPPTEVSGHVRRR
jgi:hypothetical protein